MYQDDNQAVRVESIANALLEGNNQDPEYQKGIVEMVTYLGGGDSTQFEKVAIRLGVSPRLWDAPIEHWDKSRGDPGEGEP